MNIEKFINENKAIVKLFTGEDYNPVVKKIKYDGKIGSNLGNVQKIFDLIQEKGNKISLLIAPTCSGKTYITDKMLQMSYANVGGVFCPNRVQNEQNSQLYTMRSIVGGKSLDDTYVDEKLRFSAVYDKAETVLEEIYRRARAGKREPLIFIDEAHILVDGYIFRHEAICAMKELIDDAIEIYGGKVVYITATPDQLLNTKFDLIINCIPENYTPVAKNFTVLETSVKQSYIKTVLEQVVKLVGAGKIPFVRLNGKPAINKLQKELAVMEIVSESVTGDDKTYTYNESTREITYDNNIYGEVVKNSQLPRKTKDGKVIQVYLCTSVLECGTNIVGISGEKDATLTPVFCVPDINNANPDAVEQFFNRVRYQIDDCYLIIKNENYNNMVENAVEKLNNIGGVRVSTNDSGTYFEVYAKTRAAYRKVCSTCNKSKVFYTIKDINDKHKFYRVDICKKSFMELEQIVADQITRNRKNYKILNTIFTGYKDLFVEEIANNKIDNILKTPTAAGTTNSLGIVIRQDNELVIDNSALWKYTRDLYCKQYYYMKDTFYNELENRLGIMNISVKKAENLNINMKEIEDKIKKQTIKILEIEIEKNDNLLKDILEDKTIDGLKNIRKTDEYKSFVRFVKLNHDISASYNIVRDSNKACCYKLYNELLKKKIGKLTSVEKTCIEKLAKIDKPDFTIVKNDESLEVIKIIIESGYWELIVDAVNAGISVDLIIKQIVKADSSKESVKIYIQRTIAVRLLKSVNYEFTKLGDTIAEREIKIALNMFYIINNSGNLVQATINDSDLVKLQNELNTKMRIVSNIYYSKKNAKNLLLSVFNTREKNKTFALMSIARAAL